MKFCFLFLHDIFVNETLPQMEQVTFYGKIDWCTVCEHAPQQVVFIILKWAIYDSFVQLREFGKLNISHICINKANGENKRNLCKKKCKTVYFSCLFWLVWLEGDWRLWCCSCCLVLSAWRNHETQSTWSGMNLGCISLVSSTFLSLAMYV